MSNIVDISAYVCRQRLVSTAGGKLEALLDQFLRQADDLAKALGEVSKALRLQMTEPAVPLERTARSLVESETIDCYLQLADALTDLSMQLNKWQEKIVS